MTVRLQGRLICADAEQAESVRRHLPEHSALSRAEAGCLIFEVWQDPDNPLIWQVNEAFADQAAFEQHQTRTRASQWWRATADIKREYILNTQD